MNFDKNVLLAMRAELLKHNVPNANPKLETWFPDARDFYINYSNNVLKRMKNRYFVMQDEINRTSPMSSDIAGNIILKHWPTPLQLFLDTLPYVPEEHLLLVFMLGHELCKGALTVIVNMLDKVDPIEFIEKQSQNELV